ncbi:unnamed protein product [Paramecium primaurelia]|uniref:Uncharacterized protein n=1 Tax=Paramecium primaurelia TaxID=5886 RepID=A0A8S1KES1_PARPR|nr:unnamed protein product [Paramecium primaurelia]
MANKKQEKYIFGSNREFKEQKFQFKICCNMKNRMESIQRIYLMIFQETLCLQIIQQLSRKMKLIDQIYSVQHQNNKALIYFSLIYKTHYYCEVSLLIKILSSVAFLSKKVKTQTFLEIGRIFRIQQKTFYIKTNKFSNHMRQQSSIKIEKKIIKDLDIQNQIKRKQMNQIMI